MRAGFAALLVGVTLVGCGVTRRSRSVAEDLMLAQTALRDGRPEEARELVAAARAQDPENLATVQWSAFVADLTWRDEAAVEERMAAVRLARARGGDAQVARLRGELGDQLFRAGRWGESATPLLAGAVGEQAERRRALSVIAASLPYVRRFQGPLLTEQPFVPGETPEFICGTPGRLRPFAIDTGTSMTTLSSSFAEELGVRGRQPAGVALDGAGRSLEVEVGMLPDFRVGSVDIGTVPVLVVEDRALVLRDLHGGAERVPRGVLGLDLIGACRLTIDPERGGVVLALPQGLPENRSVRCVRLGGRCLVPVEVDGARLWFVLDTGASHTSLTSAGLARIGRGRQRATPTFRRVRTVGGSVVSVREVRGLVLRCSEARFLQVTMPIVERGETPWFPVHGVLGIDLLGQCRVTLDRGRVLLSAVGGD